MAKVGERIGEAVTNATVLGQDGEPLRLGDLLDGPSVLVLLRHFGCIGCDRQVTRLRPHFDMLTGVGMRVVLVGNGEPHHAKAFAERHMLPERGVTLATDPTLAVHDALELERSWLSTFGPRGVYGWLRAWGDGYRQEGALGDGRQQGGALVIDGDGVVRFFHRSSAITDDADPGEIGRHALSLAASMARAQGHEEII